MPSQKLSLQQKMLQKLSPQQIQVIKLLEIPTVQLEQRIKKELEENPILELTSDSPQDESDTQEESHENDNDEFSLEDYMDEDDIPEYRLSANNYSPDDKQVDVPYSAGTSFHESMHEQLGLAELNEDQRKLAEYIIGNIDEDGYLRRDLLSISDDLAFNLNMDVSEKELADILDTIQDFDPPGVGARDLQECLLLQIQRKRGTPATCLAMKIIE